MNRFFVLGLLAITSVANAQDLVSDETIGKIFERTLLTRERAAKNLAEAIELRKRGPEKNTPVFISKPETYDAFYAARITKVEAVIRDIDAGKLFDFGGIYQPAVGMYGRLCYTTRVQQVLDDEEMLIRYGRSTILMRGVSTERIVDDSVFYESTMDLANDLTPWLALEEPIYKITGTETYDTAIGGSNTVFVMQPIDVEPAKKLLQDRMKVVAAKRAEEVAKEEAMKAEAEAAAIEATKPKPRTWTTADGTFTTEATFVSLSEDGNVVTLEKADGSRVEVRRQVLSKEDNRYLRER